MRNASHAKKSALPPSRSARTIRFPAGLKEQLTQDAERCGRSFESQVLAILRRHFGEDVDIAPTPDAVLSLATGSFADIPERDRRRLTRRLGQEDEE